MPDGDESSDQNQCSPEQNSSSAPQDSSSAPANYTPAAGGQSSSEGDTTTGPPPPPAGSPASPGDDGSANQCTPEQNYTPADTGGQTSSQPDNSASASDSSQANVCVDHTGDGPGGVVAASAVSAARPLAPPETPPESPPDFSPGQAANDNALSGEAANDNALSDEAANDNAIADETVTEGSETATEVGEGLETGEEIVEATEAVEALEFAEILGALLAPEVVIPLLIIGAGAVLLSGDDDPAGADSASNQQPDEAEDCITSTCTRPEASSGASSSASSPSTKQPVMPDNLSAEDQELWKECNSIYGQYKGTQQKVASLSSQVASGLDDLANNRPMTPQEKLDLCSLLDELIETAKELHDQRKTYIDSGCDKFDWYNQGTTEAQRKSQHEGENQNVDKQIKNLYELWNKFCAP